MVLVASLVKPAKSAAMGSVRSSVWVAAPTVRAPASAPTTTPLTVAAVALLALRVKSAVLASAA